MKKLTIGDNGCNDRAEPVVHVRRKDIAAIEVGEEVLVRFRDEGHVTDWRRYRLAAKCYANDWDRQTGWLHGELVRLDGEGRP